MRLCFFLAISFISLLSYSGNRMDMDPVPQEPYYRPRKSMAPLKTQPTDAEVAAGLKNLSQNLADPKSSQNFYDFMFANLALECGVERGMNRGVNSIPKIVQAFQKENGFEVISSVESLRSKEIGADKISQIKKECALFGKNGSYYLCQSGASASYFNDKLEKISEAQCDQLMVTSIKSEKKSSTASVSKVITCLKNITYPDGKKGIKNIGAHEVKEGQIAKVCPAAGPIENPKAQKPNDRAVQPGRK